MINHKLIKTVICVNIFQLMLANEASSAGTIEELTANKPQLSVHAKGDQVYICFLDNGAYTWKWQAPDAKLYDPQSQLLVGSHRAGPIWEHEDGSSVKAKMIEKIDSPDKTAIPWLLLAVTEHKGKGVFTDTSYILRINTQGGMAPASGCDGNHIGTQISVPYSADYNFYTQSPN